MKLAEAHELAKTRGCKLSSNAFSNRFTKNSHDKDYNSFGIKRIDQEKRRAGLYIDIWRDQEPD